MDKLVPLPEPFVRVDLLAFFVICCLSGYMMGTGLGRGANESSWFYLLALAGFGVNVFGFVMRRKTARLENYELVKKIIEELRKLE